MAVFKCKMCGGDLEITEGAVVAECMYCGTKQTVPSIDNEKKLNLFNRANRLRMNSEFDKAASLYENIIAEFPEEAEAYWGLCLCNYGIEYVDDPATGRKIPTCHRASFEKLQNDENYELAMEYGDLSAQALYRAEAVEIDRIMDEFLSISKNEEPYDVFICYKETDENGSRTVDSLIAENLYNALTEKDYKVFFARISLEDKLGRQYEPYIFAALNSARVMLCVGSKYEYFNAPWVRNEWSRFLKLSGKDRSKLLIPCYKDIDPYLLPAEFKALQAQDLGKVGAEQDILRGLDKVFDRTSEKKSVQTNESGKTEAKPHYILNVCSIGTNETNILWPQGTYSEVINRNEFRIIRFHIFLKSGMFDHLSSVGIEWCIYSERGNLVYEDKSRLNWGKGYERISEGWIIKEDSGVFVPNGKYIMKCSVEGSQEFEYEFRIVSEAEKPAAVNSGFTGQSTVNRPHIIKNVCSIGSCNQYKAWPSGRYSNIIDRTEFSVVYFHCFVKTELISHLRILNSKWQIYNERGKLVFDYDSRIDWKREYDRLSQGWIIRGDDGSYVASGKYLLKCSVEGSQEFEYEFSITAKEERMAGARDLQTKRRQHNLCQHCGNPFRQTIFGTAKCSKCGRNKDY